MTNDALKMPDEIYLLHNEGDMGEHLWCEHVPNDEMEFTKYIRADRSALAPVDVEGLRTKAKNIRACFELSGNRCDCTTIEGALEYGRAQGLEMAADHLAARGCFGVPEGYTLVPIEPDFLEGARSLRDTFGWPNQVERAKHCYKAMLKAAPKKEGV